MTPARYREIRAAVVAAGFGHDIEWSEGLSFPETAEEFAGEAIWVVLCSGFSARAARGIMDRLWPMLGFDRRGVLSCSDKQLRAVVKHPLKAAAIERIWRDRKELFADLQTHRGSVDDTLAFLETLPHIGPVTRFHLAKNIGIDCAKPDIHLTRIAQACGETVDALCRRLAEATGDRIATVDYVLWRAAEQRIVDSRALTPHAHNN